MPSLFGKTGNKKTKSLGITSPTKASFHVMSGEKVGGGIVGEFGMMPQSQSARCAPSSAYPERLAEKCRNLPRYTYPMTPPDSPISLCHPPTRAQPNDPMSQIPPKYSFLPTSIPPHTGSDNSIDSFKYSSDDITGLRPYGFLGGIGSKIVLGLEDAGRAVRVVGAEIIRRGLTTPLLFSNLALDLNQVKTKMLIQAFVETVPCVISLVW